MVVELDSKIKFFWRNARKDASFEGGVASLLVYIAAWRIATRLSQLIMTNEVAHGGSTQVVRRSPLQRHHDLARSEGC
jgi:hypothetical protein